MGEQIRNVLRRLRGKSPKGATESDVPGDPVTHSQNREHTVAGTATGDDSGYAGETGAEARGNAQ